MELINKIKSEVGKVIVGQEGMIDALIMGMMCDGHILLEGVPGLAKTTTIKAFSKVFGLNFKRVQFTPDLLPSDIIGAEIYDPKNNEFKIKKGPVFTNLLLADEINRAPAKVQSALLEVMQEKQVTIGDHSFKIDKPFLVLATQNPIEQEGAYSLPEAQLDRFMFKVIVGYGTKEDELKIASSISSQNNEEIECVVTKEELISLKNELKDIHMDKEVEGYIVDLVMATRDPKKYGIADMERLVRYGASPRATIDLFKASKAHAFMRGKDFVSPIDVASVLNNTLRHRIILSYEAEAENLTSDFIISKILKAIPLP